MQFSFQLEDFNATKTAKRFADTKIQAFTAETIARYMNPYVPMRTGMLSQNYTIKMTEPYGIEYQQPYAQKCYYGDHFRFRKEFHPKAQSRWANPINENYKPAIAKEVTDAIKKGRL